jgi:hypothetical protein
MRAIVTGMIGTFPLGGVAWDYGQYAASLEALGFEVYYLEDTGLVGYVRNPETGQFEADGDYCARYIAEALAGFSPALADRWHFRTADDRTYGLRPSDFADVLSEAAVFVNVSGGTMLREAYRSCRRKIFIDTDPGWNHFVIFPRWDRMNRRERPMGFRSHDVFFTFAERFGADDCRLPDLGLTWHGTRHPVVMERWEEPAPERGHYTTLMNWKPYHRPIRDGRVRYGAKEIEFTKVEALPRRVGAPLEVAVIGNAPRDKLRAFGWSVVDGDDASATTSAYHDYVSGSRGELSVAKNVYVGTRSGWFSGRSACYLAAGRPVIVQETGFSDRIPVGEGLLSFTTSDEAAAAIGSVEADYQKHRVRARELAKTYFDGPRVLAQLLTEAGL